MNPYFFIVIAIFLFVIFRIGNRAYSAYTNGYKTWPILAALAGIYTVVAIMRLFMGMHSTAFIIISLACIILSQVIYRSSGNAPPHVEPRNPRS